MTSRLLQQLNVIVSLSPFYGDILQGAGLVTIIVAIIVPVVVIVILGIIIVKVVWKFV